MNLVLDREAMERLRNKLSDLIHIGEVESVNLDIQSDPHGARIVVHPRMEETIIFSGPKGDSDDDPQ